MHPEYRIREACHDDLGALADIERAAAAIFTSVGIHGDFLEAVTSIEELSEAQAEGRLWVAVHNQRCVGFAMAFTLEDGQAWLEEIDVHPDHGRRGLGRALVAGVVAWARRSGSRSLSLTTFRDVAWNEPFYASLGFRELSSDRHSKTIRDILKGESERGLPMAKRLVMRLPLPMTG